MDDDELTAGLRRALDATSGGADAAHGVPHPDRADLDRRIRRRTRRRTVLTASLGAVLLVAGAVGGAAIASSSDDDATPLEAGGTPTTPPPSPGVSVPDDPQLPVVDPELSDVAARAAADAWMASAPAVADRTEVLQSSRANGGWRSADRLSTTIFRRTTPDGTHLDVRANRYAGAVDDSTPEPFWSAPGWCAPPSGELYVGVRSANAVGQVRSVRYGEVRDGSIVAAGGIVGVAEGERRWVLIAQVPPTVADVRITFPDGRRDHLAPVGNVVVLTAAVADGFDLDALGPGLGDVRIDAVDSHGTSVAAVTGTDTSVLTPVSPSDPSCQPR